MTDIFDEKAKEINTESMRRMIANPESDRRDIANKLVADVLRATSEEYYKKGRESMKGELMNLYAEERKQGVSFLQACSQIKA